MDVSNPFVLGALGALVALAVVKITQIIWAKYFFDERNATVAEHIRSVQQKIKDDKRKASYSLPIPKGWYKVCRSDEIKPGQVKEYTICENILAVYRSEDGKTVGVLDADCPHLGANMAIEGRVVGDCLQCPFHLIEFGADGSCTKVPWTKSVPPQLKATSWHVKEYLGFVMVWYDSEKNPPSVELPESIADQIKDMYFVTYKGPYSVKMHIQEFAENSADFQHFGAIHNQMQIPFTTKRLPFVTLKHNVDWKMGQGSNSHLLNFYDTAWLKLFGKEYPSTKASATITMIGPAALAVFEFDVPKVGRAIVVMTHTPIDPLCMNVEFYAYAEKKMSRLMAWYLLGNWIAQWKNDISIWENKLYLHKPNVLQGDGPVKKLRRWFLQFYPKNYATTSINCEGEM